jgi:hypothetical protein
MEWKKMHGMSSVKFTDAQQTGATYNFKYVSLYFH